MESLNDIYPARFFARRYKLHWRAPYLCKAIQCVLEPTSVLDVGCATGDLVKGFLDLGIASAGIEGSEAVIPYLVAEEKDVWFLDLRKSIRHLQYTLFFDLVTCFEVAEHIEAEYADEFLDNLCYFHPRQILLSAAGPGQGGVHHVNCQEPPYWIEKFAARGYVPDETVVNLLRLALQADGVAYKPGIKAIYYNMMYFRKRS